MSFWKRLFGKEDRNMGLKSRDGWESILGDGSKSGVTVTPTRAMSIPAALSAIRLLSESVASLPLALYRKDRQGGRERAQDHPLHRLLHGSPNDRQTAFMLKEVLMLGLLTHGNGYCLIDWQQNGQPAALWPIEPSRVGIDQDPDTGQITYKISTGTGQVDLPPEEILHIPGLCFDGLRGYSIIHAAREALGSAISELEHGATYFRNAAMPSGVLIHPGKLRPESKTSLREAWHGAYGNPGQAHRTALLEEGMKFEPITLNNKDSQWLESRNFSVKEVARIFRVPPHLLGDLERASYSSIEAQNLEYLTYTLRPWLTRIEQAVTLKLLTPREQKNLYVEFITADLLRADTKTRFESYEISLRSGWMNINEVRQRENLPPVEGGETHLVQLNTTTLEKMNQPDPIEPADPDPEPRNIETRQTARERYQEEIAKVVETLLKEEKGSLLKKAADQPGQLEEVIHQYYDGRPPEVKAKMLPLYSAIINEIHRQAADKANAGTWDSDKLQEIVDSYTEAFAQQHSRVGKNIALQALAEEVPEEALKENLDTALTTKPAKAGMLEATALGSKILLDTWRDAGVERIRWVAEPDACEFCQEMDGKVTAVGSSFANAGEDLPGSEGNLSLSDSVISPPIHLGCQCTLEIETGV